MGIAPNVHRVTVGDAYNNVYLLTGDRAIFIDSGRDDAEEVIALLECWESPGRPEVAAILLTHRHADHPGSASRLAEATKGVIVSSPTEKPHIDRGLPGTGVDQTVSDGETIDLGGATVEFVYTPGHTIGSLSAYYMEGGGLFAGDTIRTTSPFVMDPGAGDMGLHLDSLQKLLDYDSATSAPWPGPRWTGRAHSSSMHLRPLPLPSSPQGLSGIGAAATSGPVWWTGPHLRDAPG